MRRTDGLAIVGTALVALGCTFGMLRPGAEGLPSYDLYGAHYPNVVYVLRALHQGHGLLWNALQNCGQPFVPSTLLGLFYPLHLVFLAVDVDTGFLLLTVLHLAIGGLGGYLLARHFEIGRTAAFCGAAAFQLSGSTIALATWLPSSILGIYVWVPFVVLCVEHILVAPTVAAAVALGIALTLQILPGYPQIVVFTGEIVALRVAWELATTRGTRPVRVLAALGLGVALASMLSAIQLLPMLEFARESIRNRNLAPGEMNFWGQAATWAAFRAEIGTRAVDVSFATFSMIGCALAVPGLLHDRLRRVAVFYVLATALLMAFAFRNPIADVHQMLPFGRTFREPRRWLWMVGFSMSVLVAIGTDAAMKATDRRRPMVLLTLLLGAGVLLALSPVSLPAWEWTLFGMLLVTTTALPVAGRVTPVVRAAIPVLLIADLAAMGMHHVLYFRDGTTLLYRAQTSFEMVKERMRPQDRVYTFSKNLDYVLIPKSASIFDVAAIGDYEPQTSKRFAELFVYLLTDHPMIGINNFVLPQTWQPRNGPLLNLMATRYVLAAQDADPMPPELLATLRLVNEIDGVRIYENPMALPRAYYVPRLQAVTYPVAALARRQFDPRLRALVDTLPAEGGGTSGDGASATVDILSDRSEEVQLGVVASDVGFVVLSDQYYPGWEATVNGVAAPILRVNHAFRAVRVPAGTSSITFRYRPWSVRLGALISALAIAGLAVFGIAHLRSSARLTRHATR
jgi:hypothetical protein